MRRCLLLPPRGLAWEVLWAALLGGPSWYITREEAIEALEEYQKDLEQELAEVVSRIEKLKKETAKA